MLHLGINDTALVTRLKLGDAEAYSQLYDIYWEDLYIQAYKRINDEDLAKDMVQNVFINIWQRRETLTIETAFSHYLRAAVKFQIFSYFRSEKAKSNLMEQTLLRFSLSSTINDLEGYYELEQLIAAEIELLPDKMKEAYLLKAAKHSTSEIARQLNLKEQTVSNHLSEALRRIRIKLGAKYPDWVVSVLILLFKILHD